MSAAGTSMDSHFVVCIEVDAFQDAVSADGNLIIQLIWKAKMSRYSISPSSGQFCPVVQMAGHVYPERHLIYFEG